MQPLLVCYNIHFVQLARLSHCWDWVTQTQPNRFKFSSPGNQFQSERKGLSLAGEWSAAWALEHPPCKAAIFNRFFSQTWVFFLRILFCGSSANFLGFLWSWNFQRKDLCLCSGGELDLCLCVCISLYNSRTPQWREGSMMATGAPNAQSFEEGAKEPEPWTMRERICGNFLSSCKNLMLVFYMQRSEWSSYFSFL